MKSWIICKRCRMLTTAGQRATLIKYKIIPCLILSDRSHCSGTNCKRIKKKKKDSKIINEKNCDRHPATTNPGIKDPV